MPVRRATVNIAGGEDCRPYMRGCEKTTATQANVFGTSDRKPLADAANKSLYYEVEVQFRRSQSTDEEHTSVYRFRLYTWEIVDGKPVAELSLPYDEWQDFTSFARRNFPGFDAMVNTAVDRINSVRETSESFTPKYVGAPPPVQRPIKLTVAGETQTLKWIADLEARRTTKALERQLKRQKRALARAVIDGIGLGGNMQVGTAALKSATNAINALGLKQKWSTDKMDRVLLDFQGGFGYYQQELRDSRLK